MLALGKLLELTLAGREPAEKIQVCASGARLRWKVEGVLAVDPPAGGDGGLDLLLSAGIHGDESAGVALLEELLHDIAACRLVPAARLLLVLGNPAALRRGTRCSEHDLDSLFGAHDLSVSGADVLRSVELALQVELFFAMAGRRRLHLDLHSAPRPSLLGPFAFCPDPLRPPAQAVLARLQAAGMAAAVLLARPSLRFVAFSAERCDAESAALELGAATDAQLAGVRQWLRGLVEGREPSTGEAAGLPLFRVSRELPGRGAGVRLQADLPQADFAALRPGSLLAEDGAGRRWLVEEVEARLLCADPRAVAGQCGGLVVVPLARDALGSE